MTGPIGFLGLSHLGVVMSACWASLGHWVIAVGEPVAVLEPGMESLGGGDRLTISRTPASLAPCPLVFVTLDTSDPLQVEGLVDAAVPFVRPDATLVVMSQIPPGTTRRLAVKWHDPAKVYYLAETLITGQAVARCLRPERFILGCPNPPFAEWPLLRILTPFACPILPMRYESAEFAKIAVNLYLASSIEYATRMAPIAAAVGADWIQDVVPALRLDPRIGLSAYLRPGAIGPNIGRDVNTLDQLEARYGSPDSVA